MKKDIYERTQTEIILFKTSDVILTSTGTKLPFVPDEE